MNNDDILRDLRRAVGDALKEERTARRESNIDKIRLAQGKKLGLVIAIELITKGK